MYLILFLWVGLVVGVVAQRIVPARLRGAWAISVVVGTLGAFFGGILGRMLGLRGEVQGSSILVSVLGAALFVSAYLHVRSSREAARRAAVG